MLDGVINIKFHDASPMEVVDVGNLAENLKTGLLNVIGTYES